MTTQQEKRQSVQVPQKELLTVAEVARYLRVDDTTVRRWIKAKSLDAVILPHRGKRTAYRVHRSTLDALLGRQPA